MSWWAPVAVASALLGCGEAAYDVDSSTRERRAVIERLWTEGTLESQRELARIILTEPEAEMRCAAARSLGYRAERMDEHPLAEMSEALGGMVRDAKAAATRDSPSACVYEVIGRLVIWLTGPGTDVWIAEYMDLQPVRDAADKAAGGVPEDLLDIWLDAVHKRIGTGEGTPRQIRQALYECGMLERELDFPVADSPCARADLDGRWRRGRGLDTPSPTPAPTPSER